MTNEIEFELRVGADTWRLKMADVLIDEWCELEELSGMDAGELLQRFLSGGMRARKAMYYLARKKAGQGVPWDSDELNPRTGDFTISQVAKKGAPRADEETPATAAKSASSRSKNRAKPTAASAPDPTAETGESPSPSK